MALNSIVKVQRPVSTNDPDAGLLIYNAGRDKLTQQPATQDVLDAMGDEYKAFFHATWRNGQWVIGAIAPWQDW